MANKQSEKTNEDIIVKPNTDLKLSFAFVLEDADGKQIQLSDTLTFKSALEPGMIGSIAKRITNTLGQVGQDYFLELLRDYLSKKQEIVFNQQAMKEYSSIETADEKYIANSIADQFGENNLSDLPKLKADEMEIE